MTEVLSGRPVVKAIQNSIKLEVEALRTSGITPAMGIIRVGNRTDDVAYENSIVRSCESVGVKTEQYIFDVNITMEEFVPKVQQINSNKDIHGILLFRPLPPQLDIDMIKHLISPSKDIDCMNPTSLGRVFEGMQEGFAPCTPMAVMELLGYYKIPLIGTNVVIINSSSVVGRPLAMLLLDQKATVTICHSKTRQLPEISKKGDIVVTAVGRPKHFGEDYFNEASVVIDVGINECEEGKICGDVDYDKVAAKVKGITPVPGGVGAVTTAILVRHAVLACKNQLSTSIIPSPALYADIRQ